MRTLPSARALRILDVCLLLWVAAWIGVGIAIAANVQRLTDFSHTAVQTGTAVESVGQSLQALASVPVVGSAIATPAAQVVEAGASAVQSGQSSASAIHTLAILLAITVALLPSVPVFGFYLPLRLRRRRERRALRWMVAQDPGDGQLEALLARRAVDTLGLRELRAVSPAPLADLEAGRHAALAAAELRRLGLDPGMLTDGRR